MVSFSWLVFLFLLIGESVLIQFKLPGSTSFASHVIRRHGIIDSIGSFFISVAFRSEWHKQQRRIYLVHGFRAFGLWSFTPLTLICGARADVAVECVGRPLTSGSLEGEREDIRSCSSIHTCSKLVVLLVTWFNFLVFFDVSSTDIFFLLSYCIKQSYSIQA